MATVNPYQVTIDFENALAAYCGSKYAVCVESCTSALFLSLVYRRSHVEKGIPTDTKIQIPSRTYPGVACSIIHAGFKVDFKEIDWHGEYELLPLNIWDSALRFKKGMYHGGLQCISMHIKKNLPIGRGGAILTDDLEAVKWLRKARFDGRNPVPLLEDYFDMLGWNCYMTPDQSARGLQLLQALGDRELPDLRVEDQKYPDLSQFKIYTQ